MYSVECHDMVFPKYAKLVFKINNAGNLSMSASPSLTPGKNPVGFAGGKLPKGTRVFDYDKEVITTITFGECLSIIDFAKNKKPIAPDGKPNKIELYKNSENFEKRISMVYTPDDNDPRVAKMVTIYFDATIYNKTGGDDNHIKFYLPLALKSLDEIARLCESYVSSIHTIKLITGLENQKSDRNKKYNNSSNSANFDGYDNIMED